MSDPDTTAPPRRGHRLVLYGLAVVFVAISLFCFVVLGRTEALRADLTRHMDWLEGAGDVRTALQPPPGDATPSADVTAEHIHRLDSVTRRLLAGHGAPAFDLAAERLGQRLRDLHTLVEMQARGEASGDDVTGAAYDVLTVLPALEQQVQDHVVELYGGLDRLWTSLRTLVLLCLLLCASNLGLLYLVHRRREQLEAAHDRAVALASHDALTGAWNRGAILRILRHELSRAERSGSPLGVILLDLDDFRKLNVLLGSREADHVLQEVSRRLAGFVRPYDTLGRLGGDSFLVILPSCDATATAGVAERLRQAVEGDEVEHAHGSLGVRVSLVHETLTHDPDDEGDADGVDPDLLVHQLQLRIEEIRR